MSCYDGNVAYYRGSTAGTPYCKFAGYGQCDCMVPRNRHMQGDLCNVSEERFNKKPPHISKLRTILSETIANVTKGNQLQKGESVELTLEIELMRTVNNSLTNSLVEVTIIQHNKSKEQAAQSCQTGKYVTNKMPFQVDVQPCRSESPSEKRRNWFQRVITNPYDKNSTTTRNAEQKIHKKLTQHVNKCSIQNYSENNSKNTRSNFITILPEETPLNYHSKKSYKRVSPSRLKQNRQWNLLTPRNGSLVTKLSNIFLPTRNADKSQAVQTALTALKKEVDSMKLVMDKDGSNKKGTLKKKAPVHNFGKLVSNILVDAMEKSDETNTNNDKTNFLPIHYQSFFEPVLKTKDKKTRKKLNERKLQCNVRMIAESHSDTCCLKPLYTTSEPSLQTSISLNDCRSLMETKFTPDTSHIGDAINNSFMDRLNKSSRNNTYSSDQRRNSRGDSGDLQKKHAPNKKQKKSIRLKNSVVNWGGHIIQVNKKKKSRIEHLIVQELQNLALKEGMECDVIPLPTIDSDINKNINTVDKISSFMCELDVSDKAFKKEIKKRKSMERKFNRPIHDSLERIQRCYANNKGQIKKQLAANFKSTRTEDRVSSKIDSCRKGAYDDSSSVNAGKFRQAISKFGTRPQPHNTNMDEGNSNAMFYQNREDNEVRVTYINKNEKNWSSESNTVNFKCLDMEYSETISTKTQTDKKISHIVPTGFVKVIKSDDSTWHRYLHDQDESQSGNSTQIMTVTSTETAIKFHSGTSNEFQKNIELEVDIKDLEMILEEAKRKQTTDKYVINAKWNKGSKNRKKSIRMTGKNSPAYTNKLLSTAAKNLEHYMRTKQR